MTITLADMESRLTIRHEQPGDIDAIRAVNDAAFGQPDEGGLIDDLRQHGGVLLSLVATIDDLIVGHALYTPIDSLGRDVGGSTDTHFGTRLLSGAGLGPVAILPEYQRLGIGTRLIERGNNLLRDGGYAFIAVLGHPTYYPRFGFQRASTIGIRCQWEVPDEAFMVLILDESEMQGVSGLAEYRDEFARFG